MVRADFGVIQPYLVPLLALLVLTASAWLRGTEYDEQYTLFLTAGTPRPDWPATVFPAGLVAATQAGHATLAGIAHDLRVTDVHPPLYFWAVWVWRWEFGPSLFAARMFSVLCGVGSIVLIGNIARRGSIASAAAMLITLGCYGFVYTSAIARGFAPAQLLILCAVVLLASRRPWLAGVCFGAACCCNYLAAFVAVAAIVAAGAWRAVPAMVPFVALDAWFFVAQHAARTGQFPPFRIWPTLLRLVEYQAAAVFGGLPMYVDGVWRVAVRTAVGLAAVSIAVSIARARPWRGNPVIRMSFAAAMAPAIGLLMLGAVFNNTPVELQYLCFGLPFVGLLFAAAVETQGGRCVAPDRRQTNLPAERTGHRRSAPPVLLTLILTFQVAAIVGLLFARQTMQPANLAAADAARLVGNGIVLLPRGNEGVGIVGAFGTAAPLSLPLLLVRSADPVAALVAPYRRVVLALLAQDNDSIAAVANMRLFFAPPNWRRVAIGSNIEVYERTGEAE